MTILTKSFCKKHPQIASNSLDGKYSIELYDAINDVEEAWSSVASVHDLFFSPDFLRCIEKFPASGITPYYGIVKEKNVAVGIIYFQSKYVRLKDNLRKPGSEPKNTLEKLTEPFRHAVVGTLNFHTIICGNLLLTGKYGFYFKDSVTRDEQFYLVIKATDKLSAFLKKQDIKPGLILIKDFFTDDTPASGEYHQGFTKFTVQPKMLLELKPEWKTFDDYLDDTTKSDIMGEIKEKLSHQYNFPNVLISATKKENIDELKDVLKQMIINEYHVRYPFQVKTW